MNWEEFVHKCREMSGETGPIPCDYYNAYCGMHEGEPDECIYKREPLMVDIDNGYYCCRSAEDCK